MRGKIRVYKQWSWRIVRKFLWWPKALGDEWRWGEWAYISQQFVQTLFGYEWREKHWSTEEDYASDEAATDEA